LSALINTVDRAFPGFSAAVAQSEMATAATMRRYLNTPEGALYGFAPEPPKGLPVAGTKRAVETAVPGLWLASSYGGFGGFTGAMMTGALAAQAALRAQT
jgi:phytoene dehydrogenase-like protein